MRYLVIAEILFECGNALSRYCGNPFEPKSGKDNPYFCNWETPCSCQPFLEYRQQCQEIVNLSSTTSDNRIRKKQKKCQPKSGKDKEMFQRYSVTAAGQVIPYLNN